MGMTYFLKVSIVAWLLDMAVEGEFVEGTAVDGAVVEGMANS